MTQAFYGLEAIHDQSLPAPAPARQQTTMSWILNPEGDGGGRIRQRPPKINNLPKDQPLEGPAGPGTPRGGLRTPGSASSIPGSPWAEFPLKDHYPKVPDPVVEEREVSTKQANRPFLA